MRQYISNLICEKMKNILTFLSLLLMGIWLLPIKTNGQDVVAEDSSPVKITSGYQFTEGPYWHPDGFLLFSDIPANIIYKWEPESGEASTYINPSGHSNGITSRPDDNLILAQHDGMVSMIDQTKKIHVLADTYNGKRLNSPNDVTVSSNGIVYFTDPPFGVNEDKKELDVNGVYMLLPDGGLKLMYEGFERPNGIVLSPEETKVYVNDTSTGQIIVFDRAEDGSLTNMQKFANVGSSTDSGAADGMVVDQQGRLYSTGPGGIYVFSSEGEKIQQIKMPARATNMGWGGPENKSLFITTPSAVYRMEMSVTGVKK